MVKISATTLRSRAGGMWLIPLPAGVIDKQARLAGIPLGALEVPETLGEQVRLVLPGSDAGPVVVVSMGESKACSSEKIRRVGGAMAKALKSAKCRRAMVNMGSIVELCPDGGVRALCEGLELGSFRFDRHKTDQKAVPDCHVSLGFSRGRRSWGAEIRRACTVASAANYARHLAHEPANVINPLSLVSRARALAKAGGMKCKVVDEKQMKRSGMGAILAVGQGSSTPPRLIVMDYAGSGRGKPVVLVGKAITFDTGGYSLKDKQGIVGMKYDKCGGMAVLGVMRAVAELKLKVPVVGIIAAAENMISERAYRPNDIIKTMSGKTVEIISTDAEGRLVLADALTYAQQHYKPRAVIDLATLTGGVVVALGRLLGGIFCNDAGLRDALLAAGERTYERLWSLPLDDDYFDLLKSEDGDMQNSAGKEGHASLGAVFLKQFVNAKIPWAHLDIAGVAAVEKAGPYCPPGATGFGVRLLCDYLERL